MSTHNMFSLGNKKNINTLMLKKKGLITSIKKQKQEDHDGPISLT